MTNQVTLTVKKGMFPGKKYVFQDRTLCTVGRASDCVVQFPNNLAHQDVSRHHCLLDIDPPAIRVRDLGSRNGTFVNGTKIGQREKNLNPEEANPSELPEFPLGEGDEIKIGNTVFRIALANSQESEKTPQPVPQKDSVPVI